MKKRSPARTLAGMLVLLLPLHAGAQQYQTRETATEVGKPAQHIFHNGKQYLVVSHPDETEGPASIAAFGDDLQSVYEKPLECLADNEYIQGIYLDDMLHFFTRKGKQQIMHYAVNAETGEAATVDSLFKRGRQSSGMPYRFGSSEDSSYFYFFCVGYNSRVTPAQIEGVVMDRRMKVVNSFAFTSPDDYYMADNITAAVSRTGELSILYDMYQKSAKNTYDPQVHILMTVDTSGTMTPVVMNGLPSGNLDGVDWKAEGGKLEFTGVLRKRKEAGYEYLVTGAYDPKANDARFRETALQELLLKDTAMGDAKTRAPQIHRILQHKDGSQTIIYQLQESFARGSAQGNSVAVRRLSDLYVLRLNAANEAQWMRTIKRLQDEQDDEVLLGSCYFTDEHQGLHVLFYDERSNASVAPEGKPKVPLLKVSRKDGYDLASVYITAEGKVRKSFLKNMGQQDYLLTPSKTTASKCNELIYISTKYTSSKRSSKYKLGVVQPKS